MKKKSLPENNPYPKYPPSSAAVGGVRISRWKVSRSSAASATRAMERLC
ncbi:MAG: hypothetical protein P8Z71_13625 [Candidatus Sulfobium sp.]